MTELWEGLEPISDDEYAQRTEKVRAAAEAEGLDAVIAYSNAKVQANVRYLSEYYTRFAGHQWTEGGYYMFGSCACLVPVEGEPLTRTDQLWDVVRAGQVSRYPDVGAATELGAELGRVIADRGLKRIGVDNWYLFPARDYLALREQAPDAEIVPTNLLSEVRRVKSPAELERIRRAEKIADAAVMAAMDGVKPGVTEYEVGLIADETLRRMGDIENAGGCIVGAGPNSASGSSLPVRENVIKAGEWVLFDVLPRFDGYCGDIARMRAAGDPGDLGEDLSRLHEATVQMNEAVLAIAKAGVSPKELNERALDVATEYGFADAKIELVGHGVGLDIHDIPDYYWDETPLQAGEVITVEPCLLVDGLAGTRIEDVIAIEEDGCEVLTAAPKGLYPAAAA